MDRVHRLPHSVRRTLRREVRLCPHRLSSPTNDQSWDAARLRRRARQQLHRDLRAGESDLRLSPLSTSADLEALQAKARMERTRAATRTMRSSRELLKESHVRVV